MAGTRVLPVALLVMVAAAIEAIGGGPPAALLADFSLVAVVVAARERRHAAMLMATGIACALTSYGAMLLPLAVGVAVQRRVGMIPLLLVPAMAVATMAAMGALPQSHAEGSIGLWTIVPDRALSGLLFAITLGSLAWLTAALTARPLPGADLDAAALVVALISALVLPDVPMAVPVALTMLARDRRILLAGLLAASLGGLAQPIAGTLALTATLFLAARPFLRPAANDNLVWAAA